MKEFRYLPNTAILELDTDKCIGCKQCTQVCPHRVLEMAGKKVSIVDPNGCMECGACVQNCPADALYTNPSDGCGCAAFIIAACYSKIRGKEMDSCGC